jgi:exodeoxyribonuclease V beta subunit
VKNFDYERDFGGVIYLFVRGVRADQDTGVFFTKPSLALVEAIEGLMA